MGIKYTFRCSKCGYEVLTTAGNNYGMFVVVDTYICKSCSNIVNVCVGEYGQTYSKEESVRQKDKSAIDIEFFVCEWHRNSLPVLKYPVVFYKHEIDCKASAVLLPDRDFNKKLIIVQC